MIFNLLFFWISTREKRFKCRDRKISLSRALETFHERSTRDLKILMMPKMDLLIMTGTSEWWRFRCVMSDKFMEIFFFYHMDDDRIGSSCNNWFHWMRVSFSPSMATSTCTSACEHLHEHSSMLNSDKQVVQLLLELHSFFVSHTIEPQITSNCHWKS